MTKNLKSPYNLVHALVAAAILILAVSRNYWHVFLHGLGSQPMPAKALLFNLILQAGFFGLLALFIWISTLFMRRTPDTTPSPHPPRLKAMRFAALAFPGICLLAFGLEWCSMTILEQVFMLKPPAQDLVTWLKPGFYPDGVRYALMATAVLQAPLLEEILFRGIVFRGLLRVMPSVAAMLVSGFLFAAIHVNAATFIPLWYLGVAFAWLYWRTGSILAPMTCHFLFNLTNLLLVIFFPELAG